MIAPLHHRSPTSGWHGAARQHQPPVNSARWAKSRLTRLRGWRGGAGTIAAAVIVALLGTAHAAQLSLTWTDASTNEDGFKLERKTGTTGAYGQLATMAAGTTGYVDGTVTVGTTYCYRLRAYNAAGDSSYSNEACAAAATATSYTVAVTKAGAGSGTVTSSPAAIDCGSTCNASVASGTSIALSANPAAGSTFAGWSEASGACTGTGSCALVVDAAKSLTATFAPQPYALTVTNAGTGSGTVTSSPSGIKCGSTCSNSYSSGTRVTLTATPTAGSTFTGWSGAACSGTGTCTVTMSAAQNVTATFTTQTHTLTVTKAGTGSGAVASSPTGISCGATCSANYNYYTNVTLTAAPATGSTFTSWSGACTGTGTCTVTMDAVKSVTATFGVASQAVPSSYVLTVTKNGIGAGILASNPAGINCGSTCSASFSTGTVVNLQVIPESGSTFTGWSGACTGTGTCTVAMSQAQNVSATLALQSFTLTTTKVGTGTGAVASSPGGIDCGASCSATFSSGTNVTLTATPITGSAFTGWSGACSGAGTCMVTISQNRTVTATFAAQAPSYALTVRKQGRGSGTVASNPSGLSCGTTCSATFSSGTNVTLTATPATGSAFTGWSGACSGTGTCTVTVTQAKSVTVTFKRLRR